MIIIIIINGIVQTVEFEYKINRKERSNQSLSLSFNNKISFVIDVFCSDILQQLDHRSLPQYSVITFIIFFVFHYLFPAPSMITS